MIRRLQPQLAEVPGITLFMQPVQDITVDDRVSRTQFQYTLEDPNADELNTYAPRMLAELQKQPELRDVASDQQVQGLRARLVFDRDTAARLGITPSSIDQTLYDAYGQREISTMFTQLNQYHVVLEVTQSFSQNPLDLRDLFIRTGTGYPSGSTGLVSGGTSSASVPSGPAASAPAAAASSVVAAAPNAASAVFGAGIPSSTVFPTGGQVPLERIQPRGAHQRSHHGEPPGPVSGGDAFVQLGARRLAGRRSQLGEQGEAGHRPAGQHPSGVPGHGPGLSDIRWPTSRC